MRFGLPNLPQEQERIYQTFESQLRLHLQRVHREYMVQGSILHALVPATRDLMRPYGVELRQDKQSRMAILERSAISTSLTVLMPTR